METYSVVSIICPNCETALEPNADVCTVCGANTSTGEVPREAPRKKLMDRPWLLIVVILHVGLLGIPLYWKTKYSTPVRIAIIAASMAYTLFAVLAIVWGCKFIIDTLRPLRG